MNYKGLLLLISFGIATAFCAPAYGQYVGSDTVKTYQKISKPPQQNSDSFSDRVNFGGNFGLSFGTITAIDISPLVVYRVSDKIQVGPGLTYIYYNYKQGRYNYTTTQFGGRFFGRYFILPDVFAHAEIEALNIGVQNADYRGRFTQVYPLLGGGYKQAFGNNGGVFVTALYNLNYQTNKSAYNSPFILRIGFLL